MTSRRGQSCNSQLVFCILIIIKKFWQILFFSRCLYVEAEGLMKSDTGAWCSCSCVVSQNNLNYWQVLGSKNTTLSKQTQQEAHRDTCLGSTFCRPAVMCQQTETDRNTAASCFQVFINRRKSVDRIYFWSLEKIYNWKLLYHPDLKILCCALHTVKKQNPREHIKREEYYIFFLQRLQQVKYIYIYRKRERASDTRHNYKIICTLSSSGAQLSVHSCLLMKIKMRWHQQTTTPGANLHTWIAIQNDRNSLGVSVYWLFYWVHWWLSVLSL